MPGRAIQLDDSQNQLNNNRFSISKSVVRPPMVEAVEATTVYLLSKIPTDLLMLPWRYEQRGPACTGRQGQHDQDQQGKNSFFHRTSWDISYIGLHAIRWFAS
jgi:hypothetical protein